MTLDPHADNPYAPPQEPSLNDPHVEVVARKRLVWFKDEQVYRFQSTLDGTALSSMICEFYLRQNTCLVSTDASLIIFERLKTSVFHQLYKRSEKVVPQTITVSTEAGNDSGKIVTCRYRLQLLIPDMAIPPHDLEIEVKRLAQECTS